MFSLPLKAKQEDKSHRTAMFPAAKAGNIQLCEFLLGQGCKVEHCDAGHQTTLFYSSRHGHVECTELFLTRGADVNAADSNGYTPIFWAAHDGRVNIMKFLVEKGADPKILAKQLVRRAEYSCCKQIVFRGLLSCEGSACC